MTTASSTTTTSTPAIANSHTGGKLLGLVKKPKVVVRVLSYAVSTVFRNSNNNKHNNKIIALTSYHFCEW